MSSARNSSVGQVQMEPDIKDSESNVTGNATSQLRRQSTQASQISQVNQYFHENPAVDNRKMRRVIAEDLEWNLMTVPALSDLCLKTIIKNFHLYPRHDELPEKVRRLLIKHIPVENVPLKIGANLIQDNSYWERCCKAKWRVNDVSKYGHSWKRMYFERELKNCIELFVPNRTDPTRLIEILQLGAASIVKLDIKQLLPPVELEKKEFNLDAEDLDQEEEEKEEIKEKVECDHFDFSKVIPHLINLEEIQVAYCVKDCGMNFEWQLFDFTKRDCRVLAKCVADCRSLRVLHLNRSKIDDDKIRLFISHILDHPTLTELDLSHNLISDRGCRAIGKLLNGHSKIETLSLCNNHIRALGAQALAHALLKNHTIKNLNLRLNRLADEGGQAIAKALLKNNSLIRVNLASNNMTEPTAALIAGVIIQNKSLRYLDLSSNRLGPVNIINYPFFVSFKILSSRIGRRKADSRVDTGK